MRRSGVVELGGGGLEVRGLGLGLRRRRRLRARLRVRIRARVRVRARRRLHAADAAHLPSVRTFIPKMSTNAASASTGPPPTGAVACPRRVADV